MRELKFRAWNGDSYIELNNLRGERSIYFSPYDLGTIPPEARGNVVLEQYTGLKTRKDSKEIYEGDILQYFAATLVVEYHNSSFWAVKYDSKEAWNICEFLGVNGATVIGNIHENPELLSKEEE